MKTPLIVGLFFGGRSAEHEVSITSARAVYDNLNPSRYRAVCIFIDKSGRWRRVVSPHAPKSARGTFRSFLPWENGAGLAPIRADVYWPVLHGPGGEDGTIQGLLELADVPYVGAGVLGSAMGMDKTVMKEAFRSRGLPVVPSETVSEPEFARAAPAVRRRIRGRLALPLFVKPANLGSSVGITKVKDWPGLDPAMKKAFCYDRKILVEHGLDCREFECAVLGNDAPKASVLGEVIPGNEFYDYDDKYLLNRTGFVLPAAVPAALSDRARHLAVEAFLACEAAGMARVDFFLENASRKLFVNEINTIPGFTSISMYPKLWALSGLPFPSLVDRLLALAVERHRAKKRCLDHGDGR
ncbi:MAG: D-alanine--D-alanine ligase [Candidatus Aminicenantes bacterium]|nr:D-alanine--D-alanine ligase [Candidatus Aminicenantes bacterium]